MMNYEQAMRHTRNHRKDRFYQEILGAVKEFPVYIHQKKTGEWELVPKNHLFGQEIGSLEELAQFASDYA